MFLDDTCLDLSYWNTEDEIGLITCPVGYGKTHYAINSLPASLSKGMNRSINKVLMLVPTEVIRDQIVCDPKLSAKEANDLDLYESAFGEDDTSVVVCCFAKLASILSKSEHQVKDFDLIIIDEIDLILKWSCFFEGYATAWEWIASKRQTIVCGLTATPQYPLHRLGRLDFDGYECRDFIDITKKVFQPKYRADRIEVCCGVKPSTYLEAKLDTFSGKTLVYVQSAKECYELAQKFDHAGFIVSASNEFKPEGQTEPLPALMDKQIYEGQTLRDYVVSKQQFPKDINVLFINDSCSVGMNIHDASVKNIVCSTYDLDTIIQVQGRIRKNIERLDICYTRYQPDDGEGYQYEYQSLDGSMRFNPLLNSYVNTYLACIDSNYQRLCSDPQSYFDDLKPYAADGLINFEDAESIRVDRRLKRNGSVDYLSALGLSDDVPEVWLTSKELTGISKSLKLIKKSGKGIGGKQTLIECVNASGVAEIKHLGKVTHNGKRCAWHLASKMGANSNRNIPVLDT